MTQKSKVVLENRGRCFSKAKHCIKKRENVLRSKENIPNYYTISIILYANDKLGNFFTDEDQTSGNRAVILQDDENVTE